MYRVVSFLKRISSAKKIFYVCDFLSTIHVTGRVESISKMVFDLHRASSIRRLSWMGIAPMGTTLIRFCVLDFYGFVRCFDWFQWAPIRRAFINHRRFFSTDVLLQFVEIYWRDSLRVLDGNIFCDGMCTCIVLARQDIRARRAF